MKWFNLRLALVLAAAASAGPASGQTTVKQYRLGLLTPSIGSLERARANILPALAIKGFNEGINLTVDARIGPTETLPALAAELLATKPDVILASGNSSIQAIRIHSRTVAIIGAMIGADPIQAGFAANLAKPGGNVTGILMLAPELDAKRLAIIHEAFPEANRVAVLATSPIREMPNWPQCKRLQIQWGSSCCPFLRSIQRRTLPPSPPQKLEAPKPL